MIFFWCKFGFGKCFAASSLFSHWAGCHLLSYKIHFSSHFTIRSRNGLLLCRIREGTAKWWLTVRLWGTHLTILFHLSSFLQMPNDRRMIDSELFGNLSNSFKRISVYDGSFGWSLSPSDGQPMHPLSSRLSFPLYNLLNQHSTTFLSSSWARCVVDIVGSLHCFMTDFELE